MGRTGWAAVLWDMDGTLIDSEKLWDVALRELAVELGGRLTDSARAAMVGTTVAVTIRLMFESLGLPDSPASTLAAADRLRELAGRLFRHGLVWRPGAREALTAVRRVGTPMALVTTTERWLTEIALDVIGRDHFAVTVCGDEVDGLNKPHPEPYLRAARLLGVPVGDCLAVEDSPTGARSAAAAGAEVLVVPCDVPVPDDPRWTVRTTLIGFDPSAMFSRTAEASGGRPG